MGSTLSILNWTPAQITPTLNQTVLESIPRSAARDNYYPYNQDVPRVPGAPPPGILNGATMHLPLVPLSFRTRPLPLSAT